MNEANPDPALIFVALAGATAIVGIIVGGAVAITKAVVRHRERMAMIGMGMDPDKVSQGPPLNGSAYPNGSTCPSQVPPNRQFDSHVPELAGVARGNRE